MKKVKLAIPLLIGLFLTPIFATAQSPANNIHFPDGFQNIETVEIVLDKKAYTIPEGFNLYITTLNLDNDFGKEALLYYGEETLVKFNQGNGLSNNSSLAFNKPFILADKSLSVQNGSVNIDGFLVAQKAMPVFAKNSYTVPEGKVLVLNYLIVDRNLDQAYKGKFTFSKIITPNSFYPEFFQPGTTVERNGTMIGYLIDL